MTESSTPRYRYWGERKPVLLARPAETVTMAATGGKTAQIRLYGPIDSWGAPFGVAATEVADALEQAGPQTAVEMHMHSPGGDAFEGLAIMNLLRQHAGGVDVIVDGLAASAASIVAMGARTVTMAPGSQMMIHDASALAIGQADDMREAATMLDSISSNAADQYAAKAGKPADDMRTAMKATTWLKAQEAVDAGLADAVLAPDTEQAKAAQTAAASLRFDLSMYRNAPAMDATQTPADQPVTPPTEHKETDKMPDIPTAGLVKALGLPDDADEDTILEAVEAKVKADAALAKAQADLAEAQAKAPTAGSVVVDAQQWDDVKAMAAKGAQASARQLAEDRDATIAKAINDGKLSRNEENVAKLKADWDADPELTAKRIADMAVLYPVSAPKGHQADLEVKAEVMSDDEAEMLAQLSGTTKEALIHG